MKCSSRYFFSKLLSSFCVILLTLFSLYVIIDFAVHTSRLFQNSSLVSIALYYFRQFLRYSDQLFAFSFLISLIHTLLSSNQSRELLALQAGGISLRKISSPFLCFALLLTLLNYATIQNGSPSRKTMPMRTHILTDGSTLVYNSFDPATDLFLIRSTDDIWHIETLDQNNRGVGVNHFTRTEEGTLRLSSTHPTYHFTDLEKEKKQLSASPREVLAALLYKTIAPLTPIFLLAALFPICVRTSRKIPTPFIYTLALFSLFAYFTILTSVTTLIEHGIL